MLRYCSHMLMYAGYSHITGGYPGGQAQYARVLWGKAFALPSQSLLQKTCTCYPCWQLTSEMLVRLSILFCLMLATVHHH